MTKTYVIGVGMTPFGHASRRTSQRLAADAVVLALADAGCGREDLGAAYYAGATNGPLQGQYCIPGPIALRRAGIEGIPVYGVENADASGSSAFNLAIQSVEAGVCDVALAVGAETMSLADETRLFAVLESSWDVAGEGAKRALLALGAGMTPPVSSASAEPHHALLDVHAAFGRRHMRRYGTTQRQFAAVAAKNHQHAVCNPLAHCRRSFTIEDVLAAPAVAYPLTVPMCAPISDGAAAVVVCSDDGLVRLGDAAARAVEVLASVVQMGVDHVEEERERGGCCLAGGRAYELAGVAPEDIDVAEVHDVTAIGEILGAEALMLVPWGEGGAAAERGEFALGGRLPINPRVVSKPRGIRSARPGSDSCTSWSRSCVAKRAGARSRERGSRFRRTGAASTAPRKRWWP